ncbi:Essential protein Yae1 [Niveomyces insectorum RCEF 264]|uniref:Protein YAE1 n=1 Tax=Niveomyces insectorum RCEF 264 TaxID=1081102 RepID=A0A167UYT9_9HYPO|nr:Essential protein Yae1 [Niveomyces insectorum RCEF 264]
MHQRPPADPANIDDFAAATMGQPVRSAQATQAAQTAQGDYHGGGGEEEEDDEGSRVDLFDDVFGAAGPADTTRSPGAAAATAAPAATAEAAEAAEAAAAAAVHPSDMHRLHTDHATAGYRDGLTSAKAASVQAGFDEGYALGAALGSVAGHLVGLLEAVVAAAYEDRGGDPDGELVALLARARQQLAVTFMFAPAYFAPDGTWLYNVPGGKTGTELTQSAGSVEPTEAKAPGDNHSDHTIYDVARAHPLVRSWHDLLAARLPALGVRWGVDGDADDEAAVAAALGLQSEEDKDDDDDNDKEQPRQSPAGRQNTDRTSTTTTTTNTTTTSRPPPSSNASALDW